MRSKSSRRWVQRQTRDPFARKARASEYRSRAVYKLKEIDERDRLLRPGQVVVDLGAAPGSWSQYAASRVGPEGRVYAVDVLPMDPVPGVVFLEGDFGDEDVQRRLREALGDRRADLVICDIAPNLSGVRDTDQARSMYLAERAGEFAHEVLARGGDFLVKLFQGSEADAFRRELMEGFQKVSVRKPRASRSESREFYVLARGYKV
jgi:23S rRNA (uridine2552-2'-O)-methyltransferase